MKTAISFKAAGVILAVALSGCVHTGFGSNKNPQQAAQANIQLAIEYMRLDKLAVSRDYLERALAEDPDNPSVQATAGMITSAWERCPRPTARMRAPRIRAARTLTSRTAMRDSLPHRQEHAGEKLFNEVARNPLYQTPKSRW